MSNDKTATYRLQLNSGFGFASATELLPYIDRLGISHLYPSPYLQAATGSSHGYDVVDPTRVNIELGGEKEHKAMLLELKRFGISQVLDLVPNHMAITGRENPWWWDVLENGPSSPFAVFFDVDWESSDDRWPNKVLLPVLGDHYGRILEAGELKISYEQGSFILSYYEHNFPLDPSSLAPMLSQAADACDSDMLAFIADSCTRLPRPTVTVRKAVRRRHRDKKVILLLLADLYREPETRAALNAEVERINHDPDAMDEMIEAQNYRLAWWRTAARDLGYRRFFDINNLVGLRMEDEEVFFTTHHLPLAWYREGSAQGMRIDHPDGLRDPTGYFQRLRKECPDAWIVAEKILIPGEQLPDDWPVEGTTGYDFMNMAGGLLLNKAGEKPLTEFYQEFTGEEVNYHYLVRDCKRQIIMELLGSELNRLAALFVAICERHRRHRDYTRHALQEALLQLAAAIPVYRTYVRAGDGKEHKAGEPQRVSDSDRRYVHMAVETAGSDNPELDPELLSFLGKILLLEIPGKLEGELAMRFQQFTGSLMAKGMEDTALYRYHRLICLNEVGGDPAVFGTTPEEFHRQGVKAQAARPLSLLAGSTHDTKRGEDVRARLALISEITKDWRKKIVSWSERNKKYLRDGIPEPNTEYFIYQTLVGSWPISLERAEAYFEKAMREAKQGTSWTRQDEQYEKSVLGFVRDLLNDEQFCQEMERFLEPLIPAGRVNGLSQTLLRLTFPGVPDIYQGCELWEMSLVDPDNRRPVDFELRGKLLEELNELDARSIMARMEEGLPKMWLIRQGLHLRRSRPTVFGPESSYKAVYARGKKKRHALAFIRGGQVLTVAPRLVIGLKDDWKDTFLELPPGEWDNVLTGEKISGGSVFLAELLKNFPVALLAREI